jgi:hypothetical protein
VIRRFSNPSAMYVELTFDSVPTADVTKADLLYDKKLAFSMRFADGYREAYLNTSAVLLGLNTPDYTGATHPGYRYTDGCGNDVMYTADYSPFMFEGDPRHEEDSNTYMRWSDFGKAKDFGHGILFHGYDDTSAPDPNVPYEELMDDLISFRNLCQTKWGFKPLMATSPGGELQWYNKDGKAPFFEAGYLMSNILYQPIDSLVAGQHYEVPLDEGINFDNINQDFFNLPQLYPGAYHSTRSIKVPTFQDLPAAGNEIYLYITTEPSYTYYRWNSNTSTYETSTDRPGASESLDEIKQRITDYMNNSYSSGFNVTTHNVKYNPDEQFNGGMDVNYLKEILSWVDANYGKNGTDNILFMSASAILDYLYSRVFSTVNRYVEGNKIILEIIPPTFAELRRPALTLKLNSSVPVRSIQINNIDKFSQNVINNNSGIINLEWSSEHYVIADKYVTIAEEIKTSSSIAMAEFFVNSISNSSKRSSLELRLSNITVVTDIQHIIDFGRSVYTSNTPPYNNISSADFSLLTYLPTGITLRDVSNGDYGIKLDIVQAFANMSYSGMNTGNNSGIYLDTALQDSFDVVAGSPAIIKLNGLQSGQVVDFKFLASKANSTDRVTRFSVTNQLDGSTTFSEFVTQNANNNISNIVEINNTFANEFGEIFITVSCEGAAMIAHLNVLEFKTREIFVSSQFILQSALINNGDAECSGRDVYVTLNFTGTATHYMLSESPIFDGASWISYVGVSGGSVPFILSEGNGEKQVYAKLKNNNGTISNILFDRIVLALPGSKVVISLSHTSYSTSYYRDLNGETINFMTWNTGESLTNFPLKSTEGVIKGYFVIKPSQYPVDSTIKLFALGGGSAPVLSGNTGPYPDEYITRFFYAQSANVTGNKSLFRMSGFAPGTYIIRVLMSTSQVITPTNQAKLYYRGNSGTPVVYAAQSANNTTAFTEIPDVVVAQDGLLDLYCFNIGNLFSMPGLNLIEIIKTA